MDIGRWDYIRGRHLDRLTHRQRVVRQGVEHLIGIALSFGITVGTGLVGAESAMQISGGMVTASLVLTAIRLIRKEEADAEPGPDPVSLSPEQIARLAR